MTVRIPANVDIDDKILFGLTARQAGLLAPVAIGLLAAWHTLNTAVPVPVLLIGGALVAGVAVALVLGKRDGASLDRLVWAIIRHPRRALAPGTDKAVPVAVSDRASRRDAAGPLRGPVRAVLDDGLDLGTRGVVVGVAAGGVNFALRSGQEQSMLVAGFARLVHAIPGAWQVVVSTRPATMDTHADHVRAQVRELPKGAVRRAGRDYAAWLDELVDSSVMLRREVTIIVVAGNATAAGRSAAAVADACAGLGVTARVLDGPELAARVRSYLDPYTLTVGGGS